MEQKKLLLIAISVGVFFVIVIGAALVAFKPAGTLAQASGPNVSGTAYISPGDSSYSSVQGAAEQPEPTNASPNIEAGGQEINPPAETAAQTGAPADSSGTTLIAVDPKSAAGVPNVSAAPKQVKAAPAAAQPKPVAVEKTKPRAKPAVQAAPSVKTRDDYWVQTGAFTAMSRAEGVKQTLEEKGIISIIENRDIEGTTYFRVRIGPYTSQNEADYWLSLIKSIDGFEESQVRKTQTRL